MNRVLTALLALFISMPSSVAAAGSTTTPRGKLTVKCAPSGKAYEGSYTYLLSGKPIRKLSSDCSPGLGTSYIEIAQIIRSPTGVTLLIIEGVTANAQTIRVLHIPVRGSASVVDQLGGDGYALVQKSPSSVRLIAPGGGFALSDERKSTWTCVIDINFVTGKVFGDIAVPHEPGLPRSVCEASLARIPL